MRMRAFMTICAIAAAVAGCASNVGRVGTAAGDVAVITTSAVPSDAEALEAYSSMTMALNDRVRILDARAFAIDVAPLTYTVIDVDPNAFVDVTGEVWARMERWYDGDRVAKIRMLPGVDRNDTEEFYFDQGRLVFVYWNPNGADVQDTFDHRTGESFYFGQEGLIALIRDDGTRGDPASDEFRFWDKQLRKEAKRFLDGQHR